jgi:mannose-6-phosphate isomerase
MPELYKLRNQIKHYGWGSVSLLPEFLGLENPDGLPWAEMWMGTHRAAPSFVYSASSPASNSPSNNLPANNLLQEIAGGELPFIFKLLGVENPLSIQAHPNGAQAAEGFKRENEAGIAIDAPERSYRDSSQKQEILCAITPFTVMAGFRESEDIFRSFKTLLSAEPRLKETFSLLLRDLEAGSDPLHDFFRDIYKMPQYEIECLRALLEKDFNFSGNADGACNADGISCEQWAYMKKFAALYPGDFNFLSPLYLNLFTLQPFQAVFIPSGALHSYISGFGAELMTASDNVLRGGLTPKYVNVDGLLDILNFNSFTPQIISPCGASFRYPAPSDGFSLSLIRGAGDEIDFSGELPAICVVAEGELHCGPYTFKKGESFFAPIYGNGSFVFGGNYTLFAASGNLTGRDGEA